MEYRKWTPGANFDAAPKKDLRRALLAEQGYLCCYCMRSIDEDTTRIEHRRPRTLYPTEQFDYQNLLAACPGAEGTDQEHCDVRKHNTEVTVDPAHPSRDIEELLSYSGSGEIRSDDDDIRRDLNETLNLNLDWMKEQRKGVLDGFLTGFERRHKKTWSVACMELELKKWSEIPPAGRLGAYAGVVASYLRKRLRRAGGC